MPAPSPRTKPSRSLSNGRGVGGVVVAVGQRPRRGEAAHADMRDGRLGAAADHDVGVAALDVAERLADGVVPVAQAETGA